VAAIGTVVRCGVVTAVVFDFVDELEHAAEAMTSDITATPIPSRRALIASP
jgi:hypothetical protein